MQTVYGADMEKWATFRQGNTCFLYPFLSPNCPVLLRSFVFLSIQGCICPFFGRKTSVLNSILSSAMIYTAFESHWWCNFFGGERRGGSYDKLRMVSALISVALIPEPVKGQNPSVPRGHMARGTRLSTVYFFSLPEEPIHQRTRKGRKNNMALG